MKSAVCVNSAVESSFTHNVNVTVFVSGIFDLFDVKSNHQNRTVLNLFLNGTKSGNVEGTCKQGLSHGKN